MKLISIEAKFHLNDVARAQKIFETQALDVRRLDGCESYDLYSSNNGAIVILQHWKSQEAFDVYRGSEFFTLLGKHLKPMMIEPPKTTIAEVDHSEH
ncbi:putative monooxygenase [Pseudovibrio axinellae]|uniref:Putative monooxygenase n=1 Tax=Pseudovibrio axinellae TaxID=989403 RepID=A0A165T4U8_9HYPH|nr:antibiotic biosynthesis monooxygenase [Pseudovibrio axinellae]KZL05429.1 putative monooxygenase [Pseudovibrio axinellae]SEP99600.1 Quinol monooxygenase YgiN [Pseudovibrio axinellae]